MSAFTGYDPPLLQGS